MRILILDNYDSFTYNLVHLVEKLSNHKVSVFKNNQIELAEIANYDKIILSPGPGLPSEAGIMPELLKMYRHQKSILGVCLGMQAIGECFGSTLKNLNTVFHGIATPIHILKHNHLFENIPSPFNAGRYHSWVIDETTLTNDLLVTAKDSSGLIMAIEHKHYPVYGVQFHPESILSEHGEEILKNWLHLPNS